ncbi:hypothetical protein ACQ4PT_068405 [Festuca glaucescens]
MSRHRRRRHNHVRSPATGPLDDDDLLCEILLRLPPQPSSVPRASAVCKRWRSLISDPGFFRRFRLRHRRNPPLLGFFDRYDGLSFLPTLEAPNRVPPGRFSLEHDDDFERSMSLGCRHGLFLIFLSRGPTLSGGLGSCRQETPSARLRLLVKDRPMGKSHLNTASIRG